MYNDLVKDLRKKAEFLTVADPLNIKNEFAETMKQAADAIEKLSKDLERSKEWETFWEKEANEALKKFQTTVASIPRWIPVTEELPKTERESYWVCTDTGYQCECRWTNNRFGIRELDEWGWSIFDIPQYQKVVAWMPRPEPPKEEE